MKVSRGLGRWEGMESMACRERIGVQGGLRKLESIDTMPKIDV